MCKTVQQVICTTALQDAVTISRSRKAHCGSSVGHLVKAVADQLLFNVCPLAVADFQLACYYSQDEACLVVTPHLLNPSSLYTDRHGQNTDTDSIVMVKGAMASVLFDDQQLVSMQSKCET